MSEEKRLIGSTFPEKFTFENLQHRIAPVSDVYYYIYKIIKEANKKGQKTLKSFTPLKGK
ncbi:hypothetical protein [Mucilaginibacter limnophilus]|uniref:hypothetical protein n=1 Tax=Mucilaginibacter limnophilus TaxID=1932778 RepID=UPI000FD70829|nr:hypothetical protein [Mucilaginibacter limnophilus]